MESMYNSDEIGKRLRRLRLESDMSMRDLANKIGIPDSEICRYENGKCYLRLDKVMLYAAFFGVPIDYIAYGTNHIYPFASDGEILS